MKNKKHIYWEDVKLDSLDQGSPAEKLEVEILADIFLKIQNLDLSQRELEKVTGLKQTAICRLFKTESSPQLDTLCKLIEPFGYTLKIVKKDE